MAGFFGASVPRIVARLLTVAAFSLEHGDGDGGGMNPPAPFRRRNALHAMTAGLVEEQADIYAVKDHPDEVTSNVAIVFRQAVALSGSAPGQKLICARKFTGKQFRVVAAFRGAYFDFHSARHGIGLSFWIAHSVNQPLFAAMRPRLSMSEVRAGTEMVSNEKPLGKHAGKIRKIKSGLKAAGQILAPAGCTCPDGDRVARYGSEAVPSLSRHTPRSTAVNGPL